MTKERVEFWLQRLLEERTILLKEIATEISLLNYQRHTFKDMSVEVKKEVLLELLTNLVKQGDNWESAAYEIKKIYQELKGENGKR